MVFLFSFMRQSESDNYKQTSRHFSRNIHTTMLGNPDSSGASLVNGTSTPRFIKANVTEVNDCECRIGDLRFCLQLF